jgi:molybdenum cofactor biosynthesis enzyme MoaA
MLAKKEKIQRIHTAVKYSGNSINNIYCGNEIKEIYYMMSWDCNLRCSACPFWCPSGICKNNKIKEKIKKKTNIALINKFILSVKKYNPQIFNISGGEPLMHKEWYAVAKQAKKIGCSVILTTNGLLLDKHTAEISSTIDILQISFTDPERWLKERAKVNLDIVKEIIKIKEINKNIKIVIDYVITKESQKYIQEILKVFSRNKKNIIDTIKVVHPMFISRKIFKEQKKEFFDSEENGEYWKGFVNGSDNLDVNAVYRIYEKLKSKYPEVKLVPNVKKNEAQKYYSQDGYLSNEYSKFCLAPWNQLNIIPSGDVWVCFGYKIGNIYKDKIEKIWNGLKITKLRKRIIGKGLFPGCRGCFHKYTALN